MNKPTVYIIALFNIAIISNVIAQQNSEDLLNLLIKKNIITQQDADSIRSEAAIKAQQKQETQKFFPLNIRRQLQLSGYTQVRYQSFQETGKFDGFDIRRIRLDFRGEVVPNLEYRLNADFAGSPRLFDGYIAYKLTDYFKITLGQFIIPFSLENITQDRNLHIIDRSQAVSNLVDRDKDVIGNQNGRDIGLQVSGSFLKFSDRNLVDYYIGYFNGAGINTSDNNNAKDVSTRLVLHPFHFLDIGGSYYDGYDQWVGALNTNNVRKRVGAELVMKYKNFYLQSEYIQGQDGNQKLSYTANAKTINEVVPQNRAGWYTQLGYFIFPKKFQVIVRYDSYDVNTLNNETKKKGSNSDVTVNYTLGVNYHFNNWSKFQINYIKRQEQGVAINNDIVTTQLQLNF